MVGWGRGGGSGLVKIRARKEYALVWDHTDDVDSIPTPQRSDALGESQGEGGVGWVVGSEAGVGRAGVVWCCAGGTTKDEV